MPQRTVADTHVIEKIENSRSATELKISYLWMRLGRGEKGRIWMFGKVVLGTRYRMNENEAIG